MRTTERPSSVAAATARLTATVVRPTPPFGLKTAMTRPSPSSPDPEAGAPLSTETEITNSGETERFAFSVLIDWFGVPPVPRMWTGRSASFRMMGEVAVYFEPAAVIVVLVLLGQVLGDRGR